MIRVAVLALLLSGCATLQTALPETGKALQTARDSFERADKVYSAVCEPAPTELKLVELCTSTAKVLDDSEDVLNQLIEAYTKANEAAKAAQ